MCKYTVTRKEITGGFEFTLYARITGLWYVLARGIYPISQGFIPLSPTDNVEWFREIGETISIKSLEWPDETLNNNFVVGV